MQCVYMVKVKKHIIFHIPYIIVVTLCPDFLKRGDFYKANRYEKRGVLYITLYYTIINIMNIKAYIQGLCTKAYI